MNNDNNPNPTPNEPEATPSLPIDQSNTNTSENNGSLTTPEAPTDTSVTNAASIDDKTASPSDTRVAHIKGLLIKTVLGCLVAAAGVAVIAILAGSMGDIAWKAIGTIIHGIIHIMFGVLSLVASGDPRLRKSTDFVINVSLVVTILSFFTSVFATWEVITGSLPWKLYLTYAIILFVVLHAKTLMDVEAVYDKVKNYVRANYVFMALVAVLLLGVVYVDSRRELLDGFYGRLLAASAIIDVTIGIIIAVMQRLYIQKHPEQAIAIAAKNKSAGSPAVKVIIVILLFLFFIWPLMGMLLSSTY